MQRGRPFDQPPHRARTRKGPSKDAEGSGLGEPCGCAAKDGTYYTKELSKFGPGLAGIRPSADGESLLAPLGCPFSFYRAMPRCLLPESFVIWMCS